MSYPYENSLKISVVLTSYNQRAFLVEAIESVLQQTVMPYEIIIADDCSTDGSPEVIEGYARHYPEIIRPLFQEKNLGVARNRSAGFAMAAGDFITWANGDDRLLPRKLELELETYKANPRARWVYSQVYYVDRLGQRMRTVRYTGRFRTQPYRFEDVAAKIGREPAYQFMDRHILDQVGLFDSNLKIYEDWDFAIRLARHAEGAYCPTPLYEYRQYKGGLSSLGYESHLRAVKRVYENVLPLLNGLPEKKARKIRGIFTAKVCDYEALCRLEKGRKPDALKYLLKAFRAYPFELFRYEIAVMFLFPHPLLNLLRSLKRKHLQDLI
jgi:glycosyltransferase involved in cell wall biosynthesis